MNWEEETKRFRKAVLEEDFPNQLSRYWNVAWCKDPRSILFTFSRYKFVLKMLSAGDSVLEVGCGEGIGASLISSGGHTYTGIDRDPDKIAVAKSKALTGQDFSVFDILSEETSARYDVVFSLDVVEHIFPSAQDCFVRRIRDLLYPGGMFIVGSPSKESQVYASAVSKAGHVGLLSAEDQASLVGRYFRRVLRFSMNDEVIHTGFSPMSHYNFSIGFA